MFFVEQGLKYIPKQAILLTVSVCRRLGLLPQVSQQQGLWLSSETALLTGSLRFSSQTAAASGRM
jgi:hypothetical protein